MSSKKAASSGSRADDTSRGSGPLSLAFNDEASFRAFTDRLTNDVRASYGEIASFVTTRKYPFRSVPTDETAVALLLS